ncbi:MAG TPA: NTP transferase domain-containing protein [Anaerohalosphaeraceae bacterium]|nr:NTP transferase domain-containing protein [Anaerohalosphaeraceae bacterium]
MIWIFPMAGRGSRTQTLGAFKPFIEIGGRKVIEWLLVSIRRHILPEDELVFITTESFAAEYEVESQLAEMLDAIVPGRPFHLVTCPTTPPGPSASVYAARNHFDNPLPAAVVNCDQFIDFERFEWTSQRQGFLPVYANFGSRSSYVEIRDGRIVRVVEKQNISNLASAGVYALSCGRALREALEMQFEKGPKTGEEYYVGPAFNYLIERGYELIPTAVRAKYDLGCVEGIERFQKTWMCETGIKVL